MFYGGMSSVPGAPGNLMAGSPGYFPSGAEIQDRFFRQGADTTKTGEELKQKIENFKGRYQHMFAPQAGGMQQLGNMGALANAQFYGGPQMGMQVPPGFQNKYVS